jgi:uncharacterized protein (TIGR03083 family)
MDEVEAWRETQLRVCALVEGLDGEQVGTRVPATPDWTVRDLLSHMVGLGADVLAGDEPDDHNATWTQTQVDARRDRSAAELLAEWRGLADDLVAWMREHGTRPLGDVVIHEQDLRGAVDAPGGRDSVGFALIRDRMAARFGRAAAGLPPVALVADDGWAWCSSGAVDDAEVVLTGDGFDLGRAVTSRRTAAQLRALTSRGDVTPYLDAFAGLGPLPDHPLPE